MGELNPPPILYITHYNTMKKIDSIDVITLVVVLLLLFDNDFSYMTPIKWIAVISTGFLFVSLMIKYYVVFFKE